MRTQSVKVSAVQVGERVRKEFGNIEEMAVSMTRFGLLEPIIVDKGLKLVAGERRLRAAQLLGWELIDVRFIEDGLDDMTRLEIELEENMQRKDFTWQEEVLGKQSLHTVKQTLHGSAVKGHEGAGWGLANTAEYLGESKSSVGQDIQLASAMEKFPELRKCGNKSQAWRMFKRLEEREAVAALAEKVGAEGGGGVPAEEMMVWGDSTVTMRGLGKESVDFILTDPPFGKDIDTRDESVGEVYKDTPEAVMTTIGQVVKEGYRVLRENRVMLLFFDLPHYAHIVRMCEEVGFYVYRHPFIWHKTGGPGPLVNETVYSTCYECVLHCQKGRRPLNMPGHPNIREEARLPVAQRVHPLQRPLSLLRYFLEQHSFPGELVVDPFAGSGSALIAALQLGRRAWGCELEKRYYEQAVVALQDEMERQKGEMEGALQAKVAAMEKVDITKLTPGTSAWMDVWRQFPELQEAMLVEQRRRGEKEREV